MNAIDLLKADHEKVKGILSQLSESTDRALKKRVDLLDKLEMEITIHTSWKSRSSTPHSKRPVVRSRTRCTTRRRRNIAQWIPWCSQI